MSRAEGVVALPGSKSISNRTLLLAALAAGDTTLSGLLDADDVDRMQDALAALGIAVERIAGTRDFVVHGQGGVIPVKAARLASRQRRHRVAAADRRARARRRPLRNLAASRACTSGPIGDLVDALRALGADIRYLGNAGLSAARHRAGQRRARRERRIG